ncbi:hypothetical protein [Synechococcus sp. PCC 7336]|uniref:hypothetical protein n=1 Tax=Synechococcus sp. PCC 7336 TaxID=195250 RepID=UPI00034A8112|nr:hypothetical protein [Synechococcus sp. PCC 7336]
MTPAQKFCSRMAETVEAWSDRREVATQLRSLCPDPASQLMADILGLEAPEAVQRCVSILDRMPRSR